MSSPIIIYFKPFFSINVYQQNQLKNKIIILLFFNLIERVIWMKYYLFNVLIKFVYSLILR